MYFVCTTPSLAPGIGPRVIVEDGIKITGMLVHMQNCRAEFSHDRLLLCLFQPGDFQLGQQLQNVLTFFTKFGKQCDGPRAEVWRLQTSFYCAHAFSPRRFWACTIPA